MSGSNISVRRRSRGVVRDIIAGGAGHPGCRTRLAPRRPRCYSRSRAAATRSAKGRHSRSRRIPSDSDMTAEARDRARRRRLRRPLATSWRQRCARRLLPRVLGPNRARRGATASRGSRRVPRNARAASRTTVVDAATPQHIRRVRGDFAQAARAATTTSTAARALCTHRMHAEPSHSTLRAALGIVTDAW